MTTWTWQPDGTNGIDTCLNNSVPTTNLGTDVSMSIGEAAGFTVNARALIKPDFTKGTNPIPGNAVFTSLTLTLTVIDDFSTNARTLTAYRQLKAWTELGATWNKYDGTNDWTTAGGFSASDCEQTGVGSASVSAAPGTGNTIVITFTNISAINAMAKGNFTNNGFLLMVDTETDDQIRYATSDNATASYRPSWSGEWVVVSGVSSVFLSDYGVM